MNDIEPHEDLENQGSTVSRVLAFFYWHWRTIFFWMAFCLIGVWGSLPYLGKIYIDRAKKLVEADKTIEAIQCLKTGMKFNNLASCFYSFICINGQPYYTCWHVETEFWLAELYDSLRDKDKRNRRFYEEESNKWLQIGCDHEYGPAQFELAKKYLRSAADQTKRIQGIAMLHKAAENGCLDAKYNLGMYYYIYGNPEDHTEATRWLKSAASYGRGDESRPSVCSLAEDALELMDYYSKLAKNLKDDLRYRPSSGYSIPIRVLRGASYSDFSSIYS